MPKYYDPGPICTYTLILQETRQHKAGPFVRIKRVLDRSFIQCDGRAETIIRRNNDEAKVKKSIPMVLRQHRLGTDSEVPAMEMQGCLLSQAFVLFKQLERNLCCKLTNRACGALVLAEIDIGINGHAVHFFEDVFFSFHLVDNWTIIFRCKLIVRLKECLRVVSIYGFKRPSLLSAPGPLQ